ncbi:MAG: fumarylacetoacetate hydrolase family protein [Chloroflexi bacterium]|nr:fumarylacetoacetate hydrolase family protein [Chloroflexota bacterium]
MKLVTIRKPGGETPGIATEQGIIDVAEAGTALADEIDFELPASASDFFRRALDYLPALQKLLDMSVSETFLYKEEDLELGPVVPAPGKIICIGLNYRQHAIESGLELSSTPVLFSKFQNAIAAHGDEVPLPDTATQYDYEAELVVVMGKKASHVSEADALNYVLGYCNGNDVSVRDLQTRTSQWLLGKTLNNFLPIGPYLVTADEIPEPQNLRIQAWLNDELRQDSNTRDMVFSVRAIVSYISQYFPLEAGDIIATGTPEGVILGKANPEWMKPGDAVTVEIEKLGRLENRMVSA